MVETPSAAESGRRRWGARGVGLVLLLAAVVLIGGAGAGAWHASSSPRFCNSCHIMHPYVEAWKTSRHADVVCTQCHYPPGLRDTLRVKFQAVTQVAKWATGAYNSKPYAEVEDASCLRSGCHDPAALATKGRLTFGRGIHFDHGPHLNAAITGRQLRCTSCHAQLVVEKHFEVQLNTCFTCHFKGTKTARELTPVAGCQGCHDVPKGAIDLGVIRFSHEDLVRRGVACQSCHLNVVEGRGEAPRERCVGCHNEPAKLARYSDPKALHTAHVTEHSIDCTRCHTEIRHRLPPRMTAARP
jgi:nitrate/TMAO reductase-like tetraheme cytochrome c subunit